MSLSGSPAINDPTVTLTLATELLDTDTGVKVSYTKPGLRTGNRLREELGNEVESFSGESVTNVTGDATAPMLTMLSDGTPPGRVQVVVAGDKLLLYDDEALETDSEPAAGDYTVTASIAALATVTVDHTAGTKPVRDVAGNDSAFSVTRDNQSVESVAECGDRVELGLRQSVFPCSVALTHGEPHQAGHERAVRRVGRRRGRVFQAGGANHGPWRFAGRPSGASR